MIERMKAMKDKLISCVEAEMAENLNTVDTRELGEAVDMIKDLAEAKNVGSVEVGLSGTIIDKISATSRVSSTDTSTTPTRAAMAA